MTPDTAANLVPRYSRSGLVRFLGNNPSPGSHPQTGVTSGVTSRKKYWLAGIATFLVLGTIAVFVAASVMAKRFEPMIREQAIRYLQERFHSDVRDCRHYALILQRWSALQILLRHGRGAMVGGGGRRRIHALRRNARLPATLQDPQTLFHRRPGCVLTEPRKTVEFVSLDGVEIHIPPKGERPDLGGADGIGRDSSGKANVLIKDAQFNDALLVIHPKDRKQAAAAIRYRTSSPEIGGVDSPMKYQADLSIPKPPGTLHTDGSFGPWMAIEPGRHSAAWELHLRQANLGRLSRHRRLH